MQTLLKSIDRRILAGLPSFTFMHSAKISSSESAVRSRLRALVLLPVLGAMALAAFALPPIKHLPKAQRHENRRQIDQLEETWRNAMLKANVAAMDSLLADDYMAILPNGTLQTKEQALASLRAGTTHVTSIGISDRKVRFYGVTALITSRAEVVGTSATGDFSGSYRYTQVYVRDKQGTWKIVSFEANRIRESGERK
jgi:ketosteroid isomerase-like protein